ncbi:MAG: roadblock/LC7 domain-containing protein [Candidatus Thorarchaeota archaeon]|jgi:predicted regulator of Ras-like GTPase activity (Roadblock/LC7/MglB family)
MAIGTVDKLERIVGNLMKRSGGRFTCCVVTNERGLVVAGQGLDRTSNETLAAMMSLLSETSRRIINNLEIGEPRTASIKTLNATLSLYEFMVGNRPFRIGAILNEERIGRFSFMRRGMTLTRMQENINIAADQIIRVLDPSRRR